MAPTISRTKNVPKAFVARLLTSLGETEAELEEALRDRSLPVLVLAVDPELDPLREQSRFSALLDSAGFGS